MKNFNPKIDKFLKWMKDGENGDFRFIIPSRDTFELYRLENEGVEELTEAEGKYLDVLYKVTIFNKSATNQIKSDVAKLALANDFGIVDRPKIQDDGPIDYISFDTSGLGEEANDQVINHNDESFENDAIKDLKDGKNI